MDGNPQKAGKRAGELLVVKREQLRGYKEIAQFLEKAWGLLMLNERTVQWYCARSKDPLPCKPIGNIVFAFTDEVNAWANRQIRR